MQLRDIRADGRLDELLVRLATTSAGLTTAEAEARRHDLLAIRQRRRSWLVRAFEAVRGVLGPLIAILLLAATVSAFLGQVVEALLIGAMVVMSGAIDLWQTSRSARAVARLQAQITPTATVKRDGDWREIPRAEVVPGDLVRLAAGDLVPADARLVSANDLHVQQAALTGESLPAEKAARGDGLTGEGANAAELVYLGTSVVSGSATAVVFAAGEQTQFGDILARLAARPEETEFERGTRRFGMMILQSIVFLVLFVFVVNVAMQRDPMESVLFSVALAVGLTPEFLPMITSVTLAQGAVRMARDKVIVKHLSAIQNLGAIDVLCSDKTGTLTAGVMTLAASLDPVGAPSPRALALAEVNARLQTGIASPLDAAIVAAAPPGDGEVKTDEIPFDFDRRRLSVVAAMAGAHLLVTKGAPEGVLAVCGRYELAGETHPLDADARARCEAAIAAVSAQGYRVIAVASRAVDRPAGFTRADERDLVLAGFLTFADEVQPGASAALASLRADGVEVKILTGDNELVARHVCEQVGLDGARIVVGAELEHVSDPALARIVEQAHVFARVSPAQKHRIVSALRSGGHVVGFLGDGINDAPSLHAADVGISVANAVDVAREAADIVLMERGIAVLHAGILAGRRSSGNVLKYLLMGTSSNFGNMFSMAGAALLLPFLPMLPMQIILNNFLYDLAQVTIPTDEVDADFVRKPQRWDVARIRRFMWMAGPISSLFDFLTFGILIYGFGFGATSFHTGWFVESLATQTLVLFVIRTIARPWRDRPSWPLIATTLGVVAVGIALPYTGVATDLGFEPLPAAYFAFLVPVVAIYLAVVEVVKARVFSHATR